MRFLTFLSSVLALSLGSVSAQIYADFTVRHGATPLGTFRARLDHDKAPRTCANFIGLATGQRKWIDPATGATKIDTPFYNGLTFHRLIHNFVIQAGSPNGTGTDGPGYNVIDEYHPSLRHSGRYMLSMAKSSRPSTNGSQFFITLAATPTLDDKHSVFGEVIAGKSIIDDFTNATLFPTVAGDQPATPIVIDSVVISGPDVANFNISDPALRLPEVQNVTVVPAYNAATSQLGLTFDWGFQSSYQIFRSLDMKSWSSLRYLVNAKAEPASTFTITGVTTPAYFVRVAPVSYAGTPAAPADLIAAGKKLILSDRSGYTVTLTFNGTGGGTWTDSTSASGTLSAVTWNDFVAETTTATAATSFANEIGMGYFSVSFSPAMGPNQLSSLGAFVSFHTPSTGYLEETSAQTPANRFRFAFEWVP